MDNEEFNQAKAFLNNKATPSTDDVINLFFSDDDDARENGVNVDPSNVDFESLGEADEIRTEKGTEWIVTRLLWDTPEGVICRINLIKLNNGLIDEGLYSVRPMFPYGTEQIIDIDYEEVLPQTYDELLEIAIENEDFEEAARLRDWDKTLKALLLSIKPKIMKAIDNEDVNRLDELLTQIRAYRETLQ